MLEEGETGCAAAVSLLAQDLVEATLALISGLKTIP